MTSCRCKGRPRGSAAVRSRTVLAILGLLLSVDASVAQGFRVPRPLAEIIGRSDAIVIGRIADVHDDAIRLEVEQIVVERVEVGSGPLRIDREPRVATDPRWAPYRAGQQVLLFLRRAEGGDAPHWAFAGPANDSEWPVEDDVVHLHGRFVDGLDLREIELHGATFHAQTLPRSTVSEALTEYASIYCWQESDESDWAPRRIGSQELGQEFADRSPLHRLLWTETRQALAQQPPG